MRYFWQRIKVFRAVLKSDLGAVSYPSSDRRDVIVLFLQIIKNDLVKVIIII